jgi:monooxygenase
VALEHVEVLIVGAGLSGIGAGCHLQARCPERSYAILEARDCIGGTWDLFRYPGVRSDSDMFTLGYTFRPWADTTALADGPAILDYIRDTARERGVDRHVRFGHRVVGAQFSTAQARWTVHAQRADTGESVSLSCAFLIMCSGYYRYDEGYSPVLAGAERFAGQIVHPQQWSQEIEYAGRRVVVVGSGATAVTLVPALARTAEHVTMLQRSPSYIVSMPARDSLAALAQRNLPQRLAYPLIRLKNVLLMMLSFQFSRRRPAAMSALIRRGVQRELPPGYDVDKHFNPRYDPWDQRLCVAPDGDLFTAIRDGRASVVTDQIESLTEDGLLLASGERLAADLIVTATGLNLQALGGARLEVDGREITLSKTLGYKGMMLSDVPNLALVFGYTNASWTLKSDLTCRYVCRLLHHMDRHGYASCTPRNRDRAAGSQPFINLSSSYIQRSIEQFPRQGVRRPWRLYQNYLLDVLALRFGSIEDGVLEFGPA